MLLEEPSPDADVKPANLDMDTARVNPPTLTNRVRSVFLPTDSRASRKDAGDENKGTFVPCAVCGKSRAFGRTYVQDHQTKGDEPFRALITRQVEVQQPTAQPSSFRSIGGQEGLGLL